MATEEKCKIGEKKILYFCVNICVILKVLHTQYICILSQNLCIPLRNFSFTRKNVVMKIIQEKELYFTAFANTNFLMGMQYFYEWKQMFCDRTKFLGGTQYFQWERKSLASEHKSIQIYFFLPILYFFPSCPLWVLRKNGGLIYELIWPMKRKYCAASHFLMLISV